MDKEKLQAAVLEWYRQNGRHALPWRNLQALGINVPYGVLVSEFMLQQTRVDRVIPKFNIFMDQFPTLQDVAIAPVSRVISLWSGLGYNRRAVMLHRACQCIVAEFKGVVPWSVVDLRNLPGVGEYTAGAIAAFGYNLPSLVVDTNILRFYELLVWGYNIPHRAERDKLVQGYIPLLFSRDWHSALMDLIAEGRKYPSPIDQQAFLLRQLNINDRRGLPVLNDTPLVRTKQPNFKGSKRFYRGRIIAYLGQAVGHRAMFEELAALAIEYGLSEEFVLSELLTRLKADGLVDYEDPLTDQSLICLP